MRTVSSTSSIDSLLKAISPFAVFIAFSLALFSLSRLLLVIWKYPRVMSTDGLMYIFLQGVRFDLVLLGMVLVIPLTLHLLMQTRESLRRVWTPLLKIYLVICFAVFVFIEASTPSFINEYDLRPNIWFIEYLKYPDEVFSTLFKAYKLQLVLAISFTAYASYAIYRRLHSVMAESSRVSLPVAIIAIPIIFLICVATVRSTFDHRAVNPSTVAFSNDPLVNTLPLNSSYTALYAAYQMKEEQTNPRPYGDMDTAEVIAEIQRSMALPASQFVSGNLPSMHHHLPTTQTQKPKNIVIILMESMGAEFVGSLGGLPLTPNIDRLAEQGLWFENMYATGTRSVRGIEAVVSSYLPTTARSVVKLPKSQHNFFTMASVLKQQGYSTSFIYGGEGQFDNMASFFTGNGFEKVIDQNDYINPVSYGSWGVPDEDLFKKANDEFTLQSKQGPFFSLVFTASNHSPFDFPAGRIEPFEQPLATRNNGAKYTDYAVGEFIDKAKKSAYWDNTIFLIIADHNSRVVGSNLVPVERFHIPALIVGGDIAARKIPRVASQIDMLPTLLSLAGITADIPSTGLDLTRADINQIPGRAIMQYADNQAYMQEDKVVILSPGQLPRQFVYQNAQLNPAKKSDVKLMKKALAHSIWPTMAYFESLYRTDNKTL